MGFNFKLPVGAALSLTRRLLRSALKALPQDQVLGFCGKLLADFVPYLEQEHFVMLGQLLQNLDKDNIGPDDAAGNIAVALGGRPDLKVTEMVLADIEVELPPRSPREGSDDPWAGESDLTPVEASV